MSSLTNLTSVRFKDDDFPLLTEAVFNQQFIEKDGNQVPLTNLVLLPQVLASLDLPPNATTLKVEDTILLDDGVNTATLNPTSITYSSNPTITAPNYTIDTGLGMCSFGDVNISNNGLKIAIDDTNSKISIDSANQQVVIGDCNDVGNITKIDIRDQTKLIDLIVNKDGMVRMGETTGVGNSTNVVINDLDKDIYLNAFRIVKLGDVNDALNSTSIVVDDTSKTVSMNGTTQINLQSSSAFYQIDGTNTRCYIYGGLRYRAGYTTTTLIIGDLFRYGNMTYNGTSLNQSLGTVVAGTVGFQVLITNVNATTLTLSAGGGQLIYSTIGGGTSTKVLNTGHSHILTAIQVGATTYGWSMV